MILPSRRTQLARREALPDGETLRGRLRTIVAASPFRADLFEPFIRDVAAAKSAPLVGERRLVARYSTRVQHIARHLSRPSPRAMGCRAGLDRRVAVRASAIDA